MLKENRVKYNEIAKEIVKNLSLEEKVYLMSSYTVEEITEVMTGRHYNEIPFRAGGIEEKGIPKMLFCDGPRGVVCGRGKSTCFPVSMLRGATFDKELEERIGQAIGKEVKAYGGNLFGGVCVNLPYHPGWGRSQETYGEESFHLGEMGAALTKGVQEEGVIACVKHYAFNQMEISRFKVSVECDKRTEREVYLPHFKKCIDAGAGSVMSSYNLFQGVRCGHHNYLLNEVLKKEWDFDGFVMSDFFWGVKDTVEAANGGQDIEMCAIQYYGEYLVKAVEDGFVPETKIDEAALRIVRTLIAFEKENTSTYSEEVLGCKEHVALALETARKGITLIKNDEKILPLSQKTKKVLVLGKLGEKENIGDHGSSWVYPEYVKTPIQGLANVAKNTEVSYYSGEDISHAKNLAKNVDAVIFVVGYNHNDEGEYVVNENSENYMSNEKDRLAKGGDRESLSLHSDEIELINEVASQNKNSIVVLIGGNTIMMNEWQDNVSAIMMAYYPGMEGATAIAEIIFGEISPSGKLPYVIPKSIEDYPTINWDTEKQYYDYYHGYAKLEKEGKEPAYPYGFGLSYTTFTVENATFSYEDDKIVASCDVKNVGEMQGEEVIQLYIGFENSKIDRPKKLLRGFERVALIPNETKRVHITCKKEELAYYNTNQNCMKVEEMTYQVYIGTSSSRTDLLAGEIII
ncbi:MAG: beta-glucosidase family protein [Lachnospiraceae bacterium]